MVADIGHLALSHWCTWGRDSDSARCPISATIFNSILDTQAMTKVNDNSLQRSFFLILHLYGHQVHAKYLYFIKVAIKLNLYC